MRTDAGSVIRMAAALEQAEALRRQLVADVAHELRNPLHVLRGNLQAILDGVYPMNLEEMSRLLDQTDHLTRLVNDFLGVGDLVALGRPVCFDATHSTQLPGGDKTSTAGRPDRGPLLARAAVAAGVQSIFLECHPEPSKASSDASTMQPLERIPELLRCLVEIRRAIGTDVVRRQRVGR